MSRRRCDVFIIAFVHLYVLRICAISVFTPSQRNHHLNRIPHRQPRICPLPQCRFDCDVMHFISLADLPAITGWQAHFLMLLQQPFSSVNIIIFIVNLVYFNNFPSVSECESRRFRCNRADISSIHELVWKI